MKTKLGWTSISRGECAIGGDRFDDDSVIWSCAWGKDGKWWPLSDDQKTWSADRLLTYLLDCAHAGVYKCTTCEVELQHSQVAGWPLFCGVACGPCWQKHLEHLDKQRAAGQVCRFCRQPYDNCCC